MMRGLKAWVLCAILIATQACISPIAMLVPDDSPMAVFSNQQRAHLRRPAPLTPEELELARVAWKYFENNTRPETHFSNAGNNYPSTTVWDLASYLGGLTAAEEFELISKHEFDQRLKGLLATFRSQDLFKGEMPNKAYHTKTGAKVNYANKPGEIGYSALDIGRLLVWFYILKNRYPEHANAIDRVVMRWNFCKVLDDEGTMYGAALKDEKLRYLQEGRLGYEEYAAKGFELWGFHVERSIKPEPYEIMPIYGVDVPYDSRDPRRFGANNYIVAESYVLHGLELGWDTTADRETGPLDFSDPLVADFADRIYRVQEARYVRTGVLTARTEHQVDGPPYFVYDTIYSSGYPWNTITPRGEYVPQFAAVAMKGALGLWALWDTPYTELLFALAAGSFDPDKGFYEGVWENGKGFIGSHTANNNGIILESLLYKATGPLIRHSGLPSLWEETVADEFGVRNKCRPHQSSEDG